MFSPFKSQPANDFTAMRHTIQHDTQDIDDLNEFLTVDEAEEEVFAMLCSAGSIY